MNIMFISKYPPIEGGESAKVYWLAKGLGERGHSISIVSNCLEVEDEYKCTITDNDVEKLQPKGLKLFSSIPVKNPKFIPKHNPYNEKLVSLALESSEVNNPDIIFGWYLLPYCTAAYTASKLLDKKYIVKHAGSDLTRLFHDPFLHNFLKRVIQESDGILTSKSLVSLFREIGCKNIYTEMVGFSREFNPYDESIVLKEEFGIEIDPNKTFLFLGKISKQKGLRYLIEALGNIREESYLVVAGNGPDKEFCQNKVKELDLGGRVSFLDPLPPWKIPKLIRSVKAIVVPEHEFGVSIHKSRIPYEAILCGKTPLVSEQISDKYPSISDYFVKIDPTDKKNFSKKLEEILQNINLNKKLYENYTRIRSTLGSFEEYISHIENILIQVAS